MDNLTHTLVGLMLARAGLGKSVDRGGAAMMMLAANIPDIDVVSLMGGSLSYLQHHREFTHALVFAPGVALIPWLAVTAFTRSRLSPFGLLASLIGVLSHLALDWTNIYGIRLLLPFSAHWFRLDITDVVDPLIWAVLLIALAAPALASLVGSEIGARKSSGTKHGWAVFALITLAAYEGFRVTAHARAMALMESRLYGTLNTPVFAALPHRLNPLQWRGVVQTEEFTLLVPIDLTGSYDPDGGQLEYPSSESPAIDAARATKPFQTFERFNQLPFWRVSASGDYIKVERIDLRFGTPRAPGFEATALVTSGGRIRESEFRFGTPR